MKHSSNLTKEEFINFLDTLKITYRSDSIMDSNKAHIEVEGYSYTASAPKGAVNAREVRAYLKKVLYKCILMEYGYIDTMR